ncbi:hypothetical protein SAMN04487861_11025 [Selenomonas ruminantium]|uniref:Uncharacterized protein n=1 Tax=Selenomonas ruminantium TaxID=971 RepID=A0A1I3EG79_SELRU|nr:hypothetical protein SAMN04487861_11025 [Selenomonas ruminantium]
MTTRQNSYLFADLSERNYNPMNDVLFKFIFGKEERKTDYHRLPQCRPAA